MFISTMTKVCLNYSAAELDVKSVSASNWHQKFMLQKSKSLLSNNFRIISLMLALRYSRLPLVWLQVSFIAAHI